jgi:hypothetical protein
MKQTRFNPDYVSELASARDSDLGLPEQSKGGKSDFLCDFKVKNVSSRPATMFSPMRIRHDQIK